MVVDDLDVVCVTVFPHEANPVLIVDHDALLTSAVAFQFVQVVARRELQVAEDDRRVQHDQLSVGAALNVFRNPLGMLASEGRFGLLICPRLDRHGE